MVFNAHVHQLTVPLQVFTQQLEDWGTSKMIQHRKQLRFHSNRLQIFFRSKILGLLRETDKNACCLAFPVIRKPGLPIFTVMSAPPMTSEPLVKLRLLHLTLLGTVSPVCF